MSEFVVITGSSGAGRSHAADVLEDLGWFVIDNLPPSLIPKVGELAAAPGGAISRVALVIGSSHHIDDALPLLRELGSDAERVRILYLDASVEVLVRRYESTRRRHPFGDDDRQLAQAIEAERHALEAIRAAADVVIDTSELNVHELRDRLLELFDHDDDEPRMQTSVLSFGYKHGLPRDVDLVIDCRFLPNPHWVDELRPLTGLDDLVADYVFEQPATEAFLTQLTSMLELLLPEYLKEGKSYLTIAFGCTGGRHRSVAIAERVGKIMGEIGFRPTVTHRDVKK